MKKSEIYFKHKRVFYQHPYKIHMQIEHIKYTVYFSTQKRLRPCLDKYFI